MAIGPNLFFISYISAVLPDLDVDSVPQFTYETLAAQYLGENFTVQNPVSRFAVCYKFFNMKKRRCCFCSTVFLFEN